ncbi:hypothetical protein XENOCAPTIV_002037, partial [Xenoophorus captivus]
ARKLQRNRAKGTLTLPRSSNSSFCRSLSETSLNQDCLVYLLNREQHTVGQETPSARPNICLFSPDILPLHCRLRRVPAPRRHINSNNKGDDLADSQRFCVAVEPVLSATVLVNFSRCERTTTLRHGDLLSFGAHYIFLYKDPTGAKPLPAQTLARLRTLGQLYDSGVEEGEDGTQTCKMCGSVLKDKAAQVLSVPAVRRSFKPHLVKPRGVGMASGGPLPLHDPASLSLLSISDLIPDLQTIFFWMSNSIEILYFIQQRAPAYTHSIETLQGNTHTHTQTLNDECGNGQAKESLLTQTCSRSDTAIRVTFLFHCKPLKGPRVSCHFSLGSKESLLSATITANEEAMTILEEVIMYTFQQCVYYITKVLCHYVIVAIFVF